MVAFEVDDTTEEVTEESTKADAAPLSTSPNSIREFPKDEGFIFLIFRLLQIIDGNIGKTLLNIPVQLYINRFIYGHPLNPN